MLKDRAHIFSSTFFFLLIVISYALMAFKFPIAYIIGTYEDFFGEWTQFYLFVSVFFLSLRLAITKSRFRLFYIVLAISSFYTFMEEISWGQRIFNYPTPSFFLKHNLQRETNIHNLIVGPYETNAKRLIEAGLFVILMLYGLVYPLTLGKNFSISKWLDEKGFPAPPLYLWPFFAASAILELGIFNFNEAEVAEILIPFALSCTLLHSFIIGFNRSSSANNILARKSSKLSLAFCILFLYAAVTSSITTYLSYSSPNMHSRMQKKLNSGIEKFAGRYERYHSWRNAIYLYNLADEQDPDRPSIQRKLAYCYANIGDPEKEKYYIEKAFKIDREKLNSFSNSISANLSIARTYSQIGDTENEQYHLDRALNIAIKRVKFKPGSAKAAYWLGRVYAQRGDNKSALKYFEKAFMMKPGSRKYRQAYMNANAN